MSVLVAHQCVRDVYEKFVSDPYEDRPPREMQFALIVRAMTEIVVAVIVANMAAACNKGAMAVIMWILGFLFWPFFFVYYVWTNAKCAAYWTA